MPSSDERMKQGEVTQVDSEVITLKTIKTCVAELAVGLRADLP